MRLLVLLVSLFGCVAATCTQELCITEDDKGLLPPTSLDQSFEKRFSPEQLRRASIRWGKRSTEPKLVVPSALRGSVRFWGKRDVADSIRRASIRWGKRSSGDVPELLPSGDLIYPSQLFGPQLNNPWFRVENAAVQPSEPKRDEVLTDSLQRVTKAEALRPKLALSSRLWGR